MGTIENILGIKAISETVKDTVADARGFLGKICTPAAEEFGMLLQDNVRKWRNKNFSNTLIKAEKKHTTLKLRGTVNPRIAYKIMEESSLTDSDAIQEMWAGLLVSSVSTNCDDDSNFLFLDLLSRINTTECIIINYACQKAKKIVSNGWIYAEKLSISLKELCGLTNITDDDHRIDRELDHLRSLELIAVGFTPYSTDADITPTPLALQLYVRSQGYIGSPLDYFDVKPIKNITPPATSENSEQT